MRAIRNILVPTDFSEASKYALNYARDLADTYGASLHLLHVIEDPFAGGGIYMGMITAVPPGYFEQIDRQIRARLVSLMPEADIRKYSAVFASRLGQPVAEILNYVREHGAIDLIVIATSGHGAVARFMLGSVADKLVRSAPCPVVTVHAHDRAEPVEHKGAA